MENDLRYYYIDDYVVGITWLDKDGKVNDFTYKNKRLEIDYEENQ
jgi:hypothetical protein